MNVVLSFVCFCVYPVAVYARVNYLKSLHTDTRYWRWSAREASARWFERWITKRDSTSLSRSSGTWKCAVIPRWFTFSYDPRKNAMLMHARNERARIHPVFFRTLPLSVYSHSNDVTALTVLAGTKRDSITRLLSKWESWSISGRRTWRRTRRTMWYTC